MEILSIGVTNLRHRVEKIELQVETATMVMLKEVFRIGDGYAPPVDDYVCTVIRGMDPGAGGSEELGMLVEEALGEVDPGSHG